MTTLDRWQRQGEVVALATLVRACGSVPRLPGARFGLTRSGKMIGSVSGGCVENDVFEHGLQVLNSGRPIVVRYTSADELGLTVGLNCGGSIEVLIEPFGGIEAWQAVRRALEDERAAALAIGLTPQCVAGRKLAVFENGTSVGSIDTDLDDQIAAAARRLIAAGGTRVLEVPWCGDTATVFLEALPAPQRLFIVGGTHTAMALCRLAKLLGFLVTVIDHRAAYATRDRFPEADELVREAPAVALAETRPDQSYVVILTHDQKFDLPALAAALRAGVRYIGILGSRKTHERRKLELRQQGFAEADLARIRAPIGLDLGARTPEETALAILAEMLAVRSGRDGRALAERQAPIHGDR